jgi:hypothetical protein
VVATHFIEIFVYIRGIADEKLSLSINQFSLSSENLCIVWVGKKKWERRKSIRQTNLLDNFFKDSELSFVAEVSIHNENFHK